eukprot:378075-Pyramimonas_sp.AAC.1
MVLTGGCGQPPGVLGKGASILLFSFPTAAMVAAATAVLGPTQRPRSRLAPTRAPRRGGPLPQ